MDYDGEERVREPVIDMKGEARDKEMGVVVEIVEIL